MANDEKAKTDTFDYIAAGKLQIAMVLLAFMQASYWFAMGRGAALDSGKLPVGMITAMDWAAVVLCVLAVPILLRGVYLIRKGVRARSLEA